MCHNQYTEKLDPTVACKLFGASSDPLKPSITGMLGLQQQRRYDMRHEMLTQRAPFCIGAMTKKGTLSQHFVTHVVPPLGLQHPLKH